MSPRRGPTEALLPSSLLEGADPAVRERFRDLLRRAGLRLRQDGDDVWVRGDVGGNHVVAKPLQNADGRMRRDAQRTLDATDALDQVQAEELVRRMRADFPPDSWQAANSLEAFQVSLLANFDTLEVLRGFIEHHEGCRLYSLRTTEKFHFRETFWRLTRVAQENGARLVDLRDGGDWPEPDALVGATHIFPAHIICAPMLAREQPFCAVLETMNGTQVVAVPEGAWTRPMHALSGWPSGTAYRDLAQGTGSEIYRSGLGSYEPGLASEMFATCLAGADRLLDRYWNPSFWTDEHGNLELTQREIAWGTVDIGFHTVATIGREWATSEAVWTSFRALGILDGLWQSGGLNMLLTPADIRQRALRAIPHPTFAAWCTDVVGNYERELDSMFPDLAAEDQVNRLRELRNIVHGLRTRRETEQQVRLDAVRRSGAGNLHVVKDIACFWWASVLFSPGTHGRPGSPPN